MRWDVNGDDTERNREGRGGAKVADNYVSKTMKKLIELGVEKRIKHHPSRIQAAG